MFENQCITKSGSQERKGLVERGRVFSMGQPLEENAAFVLASGRPDFLGGRRPEGGLKEIRKTPYFWTFLKDLYAKTGGDLMPQMLTC